MLRVPKRHLLPTDAVGAHLRDERESVTQQRVSYDLYALLDRNRDIAVSVRHCIAFASRSIRSGTATHATAKGLP